MMMMKNWINIFLVILFHFNQLLVHAIDNHLNQINESGAIAKPHPKGKEFSIFIDEY